MKFPDSMPNSLREDLTKFSLLVRDLYKDREWTRIAHQLAMVGVGHSWEPCTEGCTSNPPAPTYPANKHYEDWAYLAWICRHSLEYDDIVYDIIKQHTGLIVALRKVFQKDLKTQFKDVPPGQEDEYKDCGDIVTHWFGARLLERFLLPNRLPTSK